MELDALLTRCRLPDGHLVNIGIAGGRIASLGEDAEPFQLEPLAHPRSRG